MCDSLKMSDVLAKEKKKRLAKADYHVVVENYQETLEEEVTSFLKNGYSLVGNLIVTGEYLMQAVYRN